MQDYICISFYITYVYVCVFIVCDVVRILMRKFVSWYTCSCICMHALTDVMDLGLFYTWYDDNADGGLIDNIQE